MSEKRKPVWQDYEQLMSLMKRSPQSGYSNWHLYGSFNVPTKIKAVATLSKEIAEASVYHYGLLALDPNQDVLALRARITVCSFPHARLRRNKNYGELSVTILMQ